MRRNLNPFKRKHDRPAAYWSGIVDLQSERDFTWTVPDSFNGSLKVFAVAVSDSGIGVAQAQTPVRAEFVLTPNMPVAVAPGDEFEVYVGVANGVAGSGSDASVAVTAELPAQLEAVGSLQQSLKIGEQREAAARFRFRARAQLGAAAVKFAASWQGHASHLSADVSVRPAAPYVTEITAGYFATAIDLPISRSLYPNYRKLEVGVSTVPLVLAGALANYLDDYPHLCTEQLISRGFAALVTSRLPELAHAAGGTARPPGEATAALLAVLRSRQNAEGGFGLWTASVGADEFASVYALHWLMEARERGVAIPADMLQKASVWLQRYAVSPVPDVEPEGLAGLRNRAYAAYLLTRQGTVTTPITAGLRETLDARYAKIWKSDITAGYLASVYKLQRQDREADSLMEGLASRIGSPSGRGFAFYYDDTIRDADVLYLLSRHFPERTRSLKAQDLQALVAPLSRGVYNTLSAADLVLAFDAYAAGVAAHGLDKFSGIQLAADDKKSPLSFDGKLLLRSAYEPDSKQLHLINDTGLPGFFAVTNSGFDRGAPAGELRQGIEILREYLDAQGQPIATVHNGDEIVVRLRMRAIDADYIANVAVTDLLPGGFEPVLQTEAGAESQAPANWQPAFADVREDRVVLYGRLTKDMAEYSYRIRASNAGTFLVPPAYAESMYDRTLRAHTQPSRVTVKRPDES